jgi:hypothetical protein
MLQSREIMSSRNGYSIGYGVLLFVFPTFCLTAGDGAVDPYALPHDKRPLEWCRQAALAAHPGVEQQMHPMNTREGFHYRFEIVDRNGLTWSVTCNAATQSILKDQLID